MMWGKLCEMFAYSDIAFLVR